MRIAIFADTHGNRMMLRVAVKAHLPLDGIVFLGDGIADSETAASEFGLPLHAVAGNEDGAADRPERLLVDLCGAPALALHGHRLDLNPYHTETVWEEHYRSLAKLGSAAGVRVILFGHTHRPMLLRRSGIILLNPGSLSAGSHEYSFALVSRDGDDVLFTLHRSNDGTEWEEYCRLSLD